MICRSNLLILMKISHQSLVMFLHSVYFCCWMIQSFHISSLFQESQSDSNGQSVQSLRDIFNSVFESYQYLICTSMFVAKRLAGVTTEVNLRHSLHQDKKQASKGSTKPMAKFTRRPKQGHQWSRKKDLCSSKSV